MTYSRDDLTITHGTTNWGGPFATITTTWRERWGHNPGMRMFELKSTEGLDKVTEGGEGVFLSEVHDKARPEFLGAFKTFDMDEAIDQLVGYLNHLSDRQAAEEATASPLQELTEALSDFGDSLEDRSHRDFEVEWARLKLAVSAVDVALNSRKATP